MKFFNIEKLKGFLFKANSSPISLRKQLSRLITLCCTTVVLIQAIIMATMLLHQYVLQEKEDTLYVLENTHEKINSGFQFIEDLVITLQNQTGLHDFFYSEFPDLDNLTECLKTSAPLFSERNQIQPSEPLIERIYLFNSNGDSIYNLYYPVTLEQIDSERKKYTQLNSTFLKTKEPFYFDIEDNCINLCLWLYDASMQPLGTCIFALNKQGIEQQYQTIEDYKFYCWNISDGERLIVGNQQLPSIQPFSSLESSLKISFGLTLYSGIPVTVIYDTLSSTMGMILLISMMIILVLSLAGRSLAVSYVKPLETIAEKIRLVRNGNFDTKLASYPVEELQNISETFNDMTDHINHLIKEVYETKLIAQQAQIQFLQAQINPHFLSNALAMIQMQAALNNDLEVQEMLRNLSCLYQGKIFRKDEYFITLHEEMEIIDFYLSLQTNRFKDKITYSISYEGTAELYNNLLVPRLSIEPIVENAVCHGLIPKAGNGSINIFVSKSQQILEISVTDDGIGFSPDAIETDQKNTNHTHVGLWNTDKMIRNLCGNKFGLTINSVIGHGTNVTIQLPVKSEDIYVEGNDCR